MSSGIFVYELSPATANIATNIYEALIALVDEETSYFNLQLESNNELSGEYVIVQTIEETFYNSETRTFEQRQAQRANIVNFYVFDNRLEIWGNRTNAGRLIFALSNALQNRISINAVEIAIEHVIKNLANSKVKVSRVCFQDFLFAEDIVGSFTVDLSTYGDVFSILDEYKNKITRMTLIIPSNGSSLKMSISSKGSVVVYKSRDAFDDDALNMLHAILLK